MSAAVVAAAVHQGIDLTYIHSHFLQLAAASFLISVLLSVYLYIRSCYAAPDQQALGGSSGNAKMTKNVHIIMPRLPYEFIFVIYFQAIWCMTSSRGMSSIPALKILI